MQLGDFGPGEAAGSSARSNSCSFSPTKQFMNGMTKTITIAHLYNLTA
jgi:hypothetical protein